MTKNTLLHGLIFVYRLTGRRALILELRGGDTMIFRQEAAMAKDRAATAPGW